MSDEQTVKLRKARPGTDSFGHIWRKAGDVVEVAYHHALELMRIPDGGFSVAEGPAVPVDRPKGLTQSAAAAGFGVPVEPDEDGTEPEPEPDSGEDEDGAKAVTEPAPDGPAKVTEPAPPGKPTNARSTPAKK